MSNKIGSWLQKNLRKISKEKKKDAHFFFNSEAYHIRNQLHQMKHQVRFLEEKIRSLDHIQGNWKKKELAASRKEAKKIENR